MYRVSVAGVAVVAAVLLLAAPAAASTETSMVMGRSLAEANETAAEVMIELYDEDMSGQLSDHELEEMMVALGVALPHEEHDDHDERSVRRRAGRNVRRSTKARTSRKQSVAARSEDPHGHHGEEVPCPTAEQVFGEYDIDGSDTLNATELEPALADLSVAFARRCLLEEAEPCDSAPSASTAYGYALAASVGVSLLGLAGVAILPLDPEKPENARRMNTLISFAIGALLGDVLLHIIPAVLGLHSHDAEHEDVFAGPATEAGHDHDHEHEEEVLPEFAGPTLLILAGVLVFYIAEVIVRRIVVSAAHAKSPPLASGGHVEDGEDGEKKVVSESDAHHVHFSHSHVKPVGWLNLVADGFHNFTDGLALGGAFSVSVPLGAATLLAVVLHELPQELGDFAILLKSGFSRSAALKFNLLSASFAILGALIGVAISTASEAAATYILAFVAGSFLYISLCSMLPEVLHNTDTPSVVSNVVAASVGIVIMLLILAYGEPHVEC